MGYVEGPNSAKVLAIRQTVPPRQRNGGGNGHSPGECDRQLGHGLADDPYPPPWPLTLELVGKR